MKLKNKKILVTGGKGFLGSSLVPMLKEEGADTFTFSSKDYDLRKEKDIKRVLNDSNPDVVIHLAANAGGIGYNQKNPGSLFYDNLMMSTQLMEQARLKGVEKFVSIGSVCSYPRDTPVPFREEDLWKGYPEETNASYGLSKKMMLVQGQAYRKQYGFNSIHLLPVNLYGPRDSFDLEKNHVVPALIKRFVDAKDNNVSEVVLWGTGSASREFLYVDDASRGIILATKNYDGAEPVNLGVGSEITIKDLAYKIKYLTGYTDKILWDMTKPDGQPRRCLDTSRAEQEFGFKAKTDFDEGLKKTIDWYIENKGGGLGR